MLNPIKLVASAAFVAGVAAFAPGSASAMPVAPVAVDDTTAAEPVHAIRRCDRWGRCWWTTAGHFHGRYGWGRPYGRPHYGWRGGRHYGYGWRGGHRRWR